MWAVEKWKSKTKISHFSTAQLSLRRKEKGRLHKTIDAPSERGLSRRWA